MNKILRAAAHTAIFLLGLIAVLLFIVVGTYHFPILMLSIAGLALLGVIFWAVYTTLPEEKKAKKNPKPKKTPPGPEHPPKLVGHLPSGQRVWQQPDGRVTYDDAEPKTPVLKPLAEHKKWHDTYVVDGPQGSTRLCPECFQYFPDKETQRAISKRIVAEILAELDALDGPEPKELDPYPVEGQTGARFNYYYMLHMRGAKFNPRPGYSQVETDYASAIVTSRRE